MLNWQNKTWIKIISVVLIAAFISYDIAWAQDFTQSKPKEYASRSLFKNKKVDIDSLSSQNEQSLNNIKDTINNRRGGFKTLPYNNNNIRISNIKEIASIYIPESIGKVIDSCTSPDSKGTIFYIQDLHTNPEASLNLANILEILVKDYNLNLVLSEGASGIVDTSSVSGFPDKGTKEKVAKLFIDSGELTGEEYLSITKYPEILIFGIEDEAIYFNHILQFNKIMDINKASISQINQIKDSLNTLKPEIYSKALLELEAKQLQYEESKLDTAKYIEYLLTAVQPRGLPNGATHGVGHGVGQGKYPNISIFKETLTLEKSIDNDKIKQETQELLSSLRKLFKEQNNSYELNNLLTEATLFKDKKISPYSFYSYLRDLALRHLKDNTLYPDLANYTDYLTKLNSLDSNKLFTEIEHLTYETKDLLSDNPDQKLLTRSLRNINFLEKFFNLKISNEDLEYYLKDKESFKEDWFKSTIEVLGSASAAESPDRSNNILRASEASREESIINENLSILENFYETAHKRDIAMFNNAIATLSRPGLERATAALITGGFHTSGITNLLKENNYSYIVISPYSKTTIDEENYRNLLQGKRKDINELIKKLNGTLRAPMGFGALLNKHYREEFGKRFKENRSLIERFSLMIVLVAIGAAIRKAKPDTRPMEKIGAMFNKSFKEVLIGDIEIREKDKSIYIKYRDEYLKVTDGDILQSNILEFKGGMKVATIRSESTQEILTYLVGKLVGIDPVFGSIIQNCGVTFIEDSNLVYRGHAFVEGIAADDGAPKAATTRNIVYDFMARRIISAEIALNLKYSEFQDESDRLFALVHELIEIDIVRGLLEKYPNITEQDITTLIRLGYTDKQTLNRQLDYANKLGISEEKLKKWIELTNFYNARVQEEGVLIGNIFERQSDVGHGAIMKNYAKEDLEKHIEANGKVLERSALQDELLMLKNILSDDALHGKDQQLDQLTNGTVNKAIVLAKIRKARDDLLGDKL